jgi:hypothetical protein
MSELRAQLVSALVSVTQPEPPIDEIVAHLERSLEIIGHEGDASSLLRYLWEEADLESDDPRLDFAPKKVRQLFAEDDPLAVDINALVSRLRRRP